jgi:signal transduction histidine kinase
MEKDKKNYKLLVIEDNEGDFLLIEHFLSEEILSPQITHVKTLKQAKELLTGQHTPFDIVLLDLSLPDSDGEQLIVEIVALCPESPVIVLTGYADIEFGIRSLSLGIFDYLLKEEINARSLFKSVIFNIERKKTRRSLEESEHTIIRAIIKTQEDERYEIGTELHDNVGQILATSLLMLGMIEGSVNGQEKEYFNKCKDNLLLACVEIRNLSHKLAPAFFDNMTLNESFKSLLGTFNTEKKYVIGLHFDPKVRGYLVNREIQLNFYRILQEQLSNIRKYARATKITVDVVIHEENLRMRIYDNGVGFDAGAVKNGIGLSNIKRRAELFFGKLGIDSGPGNGCELTIEIPLRGIVMMEHGQDSPLSDDLLTESKKIPASK